MITREFNLYLHAGHSIPLVINANQYDHGEQWLFTLYNSDGTKYVPSSGAIVGIKSDNLGIINSGSVDSDGRVVINETQQMTAAVGKAVFELVIDDGTHGTANFVVLVEAKPGDNADLSESDISMIEEAVEAAANIKPYGSPLVASTVAGMTDHEKVYVYVGSETGYTSGNWYYWDGSAWTSGGVYNSVAVQTDTTLTLSGVAADAKKTGDEISDLKSQIAQNSGVPTEVKRALDTILQNVIFKNTDVYTDELAVVHNWATAVNLISISAVFEQGTKVFYDDDSLDDLKPYLTVTANFSDGTFTTVSDYGLSGELAVGTSPITVTYGGKTATFNVTVSAPLYSLPNIAETSVTTAGRTSTVKVENGLVTINGNVDQTIYITKNGTVTATQPMNDPWFSAEIGSRVTNNPFDILWNATSGSQQVLSFKWANSEATGNLVSATLPIDSASSGSNEETSFTANISVKRVYSAFAFQWANMPSTGGTVSFRIRVYIDGVRYF